MKNKSKSKNKVDNSYLDLIMKFEPYKIVFLIVIVSLLYEIIYVSSELSYFEQFLSFRTDTIDLFFVFLSYSLSIYVVFKELKKDNFTIIRLKGKKEYVFYILKRQLQVTSIIFLVHILKTLIVVNLFSWMNFSVSNAPYYGMNIILYIIINLIKHYGVVVMFVILISLLNLVFSHIIGAIVSLVLSVVPLFTTTYEMDILGSKLDYLNFTNLIKIVNYNDIFVYEVLYFIIYLFCILILIVFLFKYFIKRKKGILE